MIIDEKFIMAPPPPYASTSSPTIAMGSNNPYRRRSNLSLSALPPHLLLQVVYSTFPLVGDGPDGELYASQRENLYWIQTSLRLVNRASYIACMHILRSTYLPSYDRHVRVPYTSDPFPSLSVDVSPSSLLLKHHRELIVLDLFIALLAHEERRLDASDLHLPCEEAYRDMFDLMQPRSRLEDLVAIHGQKSGVIYIDSLHSRPPHKSDNSVPNSTIFASTLTLTPNTSVVSFKPTDSEKQAPSSSSSPPSSTSIRLQLPSAAPSVTRKKSFFLFRRPKKTLLPIESQVAPQSVEAEPLPFSTLSVAFSSRKVGLVYTPPICTSKASTTTSVPSSSSASSPIIYGGSTYGSLSVSMRANLQRRKTLVEISRAKDESLESCAKRLVYALQVSMED